LFVWLVGATRPLHGDGDVEKLHGDAQTGQTPRPEPKVKDGKSSAKDGRPKRLGCMTVKKDMRKILRKVLCRTYFPSVLSCIDRWKAGSCEDGSKCCLHSRFIGT